MRARGATGGASAWPERPGGRRGPAGHGALPAHRDPQGPQGCSGRNRARRANRRKGDKGDAGPSAGICGRGHLTDQDGHRLFARRLSGAPPRSLLASSTDQAGRATSCAQDVNGTLRRPARASGRDGDRLFYSGSQRHGRLGPKSSAIWSTTTRQRLDARDRAGRLRRPRSCGSILEGDTARRDLLYESTQPLPLITARRAPPVRT